MLVGVLHSIYVSSELFLDMDMIVGTGLCCKLWESLKSILVPVFRGYTHLLLIYPLQLLYL